MSLLDDRLDTLREASSETPNWLPTRYTPSLTGTEDFVTDGDRLIRVVEKYWKEEDVEGKFLLDDWQKWVLRHALERFPDDWPVEELRGRLRYRQCLISMGRQNGKSVLGAILGVYGLLFHEYSPRVIGLAYSEKTAKIIYNRVAYTLNNVPQFKKKVKVTKTSGISRTDGPGEYFIKPASEKAVQGYAGTVFIYDEVHITPEKLWSAAKQGTKTKKDGIIFGITTAGDSDSKLLLSLYDQGKNAIDNPDDADLQRFGFFLWEAPEGSTIDDDEAVKAANPAVASGRVSLLNVKSDARTDPPSEQQRYVLNRFIANVNSWLDAGAWKAVVGEGLSLADRGGPVTYGIDASPSMEYVSIVASSRIGGLVKTRVTHSLHKPSKETLLEECRKLAAKGNASFALDGYALKWLGEELKSRGYRVFVLGLSEVNEACSTAYRLIIRKELEAKKENDILHMQVPRGVRKNWGDAWRISRQHSSVEIDALMAMVFSVYVTDTKKVNTLQLF